MFGKSEPRCLMSEFLTSGPLLYYIECVATLQQNID